ncbi:MAG: hypothetical protein IIW53_04415 [Rikenellaceae bacterium]|nr:hypothetical protein [Rikenellaceae bacterium]
MECLKLDKFNHTFECAAITTSISRIEFTDEEQSIAYFGAMEDWPILTCRTIPNEGHYAPFINQTLHRYPLLGTVQNIDITNETIMFPDEGYELTRTICVYIHTDRKTVSIGALSLFAEDLTVGMNTAPIALPPIREVEQAWRENPDDDVRVTRSVVQVR